jgi:RHS repeat-associated protein
MRRDYYPYGQAYTIAGNDQTAYQFTQKELDNVTGFYYFGARYYDPSIGRWLVPDPVVNDFSPYSYCYNSPLQYVDPKGESIFPALIYLGVMAYKAYYEYKHGPSPNQGRPYMENMRPTSSYGGIPTSYIDVFSIKAGPWDISGSGQGFVFSTEESRERYYYYLKQYYMGVLQKRLREGIGTVGGAVRSLGRPVRYTLKAAGFVWSSPNTAIGGITALTLGGRYAGWDKENWVFKFEDAKWLEEMNILGIRIPIGMSGITFGHTVFSSSEEFPKLTEDWYQHELVHVFQSDLFGPTFLPLYIAFSTPAITPWWTVHGTNPFELWATWVSGF